SLLFGGRARSGFAVTHLDRFRNESRRPASRQSSVFLPTSAIRSRRCLRALDSHHRESCDARGTAVAEVSVKIRAILCCNCSGGLRPLTSLQAAAGRSQSAGTAEAHIMLSTTCLA